MMSSLSGPSGSAGGTRLNSIEGLVLPFNNPQPHIKKQRSTGAVHFQMKSLEARHFRNLVACLRGPWTGTCWWSSFMNVFMFCQYPFLETSHRTAPTPHFASSSEPAMNIRLKRLTGSVCVNQTACIEVDMHKKCVIHATETFP